MTKLPPPAFVYRISTADEWAELERTGGTLGGDLDRSTGCIHLSDLNQVLIDLSVSSTVPNSLESMVRMTLKNFFLGKADLYLLENDTTKIADGLIYEAADGCNHFPHFYGPDQSFVALPLSAVVKADKIEMSNNDFTCSLLDGPAL